MRCFVLDMRRLQKSHVAFSFLHAAFLYPSWSTSVLPPLRLRCEGWLHRDVIGGHTAMLFVGIATANFKKQLSVRISPILHNAI